MSFECNVNYNKLGNWTFQWAAAHFDTIWIQKETFPVWKDPMNVLRLIELQAIQKLCIRCQKHITHLRRQTKSKPNALQVFEKNRSSDEKLPVNNLRKQNIESGTRIQLKTKIATQ